MQNKFYKITTYNEHDARCKYSVSDILHIAECDNHDYIHITIIGIDDKIESEIIYYKGKMHSVDGNPAVINYYNKCIQSKIWFENGEIHRYNGPAIERFNIKVDDNGNGYNTLMKYTCQWYINGRYIGMSLYDSWPLTIDQQIELKFKYAR